MVRRKRAIQSPASAAIAALANKRASCERRSREGYGRDRMRAQWVSAWRAIRARHRCLDFNYASPLAASCYLARLHGDPLTPEPAYITLS